MDSVKLSEEPHFDALFDIGRLVVEQTDDHGLDHLLQFGINVFCIHPLEFLAPLLGFTALAEVLLLKLLEILLVLGGFSGGGRRTLVHSKMKFEYL